MSHGYIRTHTVKAAATVLAVALSLASAQAQIKEPRAVRAGKRTA